MKSIVILLFTLSIFQLSAQNGAYFRVDFKNKHNTPYSIGDPNAYLSTRAIERRTAQGLSIDSTDLPVNENYINAVRSLGAITINKSKWFNSLTIMVTDTSIIASIQALSFQSG